MSAIIPVLILVPFAGAVLVGLLPHRRPEAVKVTALVASVTSAAVSVYALVRFDAHRAGYQFVVDRDWVSDLGISWHFGIDGISLFLVMLCALMFPIAIVASKPEHDPKPYFAWLLVLQGACVGVFCALDLVMFFIFFEIVLVPMYFLIASWGHGRRVYAATKFFLFTMFGSALMLVAIVSLALLHRQAVGGPLTFDIVAITDNLAISNGAARWIFVAFAVAFAVKVPLFPLHTWLPDAHTEAPTAGSVILAAVLLKLGTYGFVRLGVQMFPEPSVWAAPVLMALGVMGITYGAIAAAMQKDLKRVVAYSSVAHLGFIILGIFSLTTQGIQGGLLVMFNHGVTTGALFLLIGIIYDARHTRLIAELSGMQKAAPILAAFFTVSMFASIGLPGLNGFPGEFLSLLGAFSGARWWAVVGTTGIILAAIYLLWAYQRVFHGPPTGANATMRDMRPTEVMYMLPLLALMFFIGLYPTPLLERFQPSVDAVILHVEQSVPGFKSPDPGRSALSDVAKGRRSESSEPAAAGDPIEQGAP